MTIKYMWGDIMQRHIGRCMLFVLSILSCYVLPIKADAPCPDNQMVQLGLGELHASVGGISVAGATSYVLSGATTIPTNESTTDASYTQFNMGTTKITYLDNTTEICSFYIVVIPFEFPFLSNKVRTNTTKQCYYEVQGGEFDIMVSGYQIGYSFGTYNGTTLNGAQIPVGTTVITWNFYDGINKIDFPQNNTFTVTVNDTESPVVICQPAFSVQLDASGKYSLSVEDLIAGAVDNCALKDTVFGIAEISGLKKIDLDCSYLGANTVAVTITDIHNNPQTCVTTVTVLDNIFPSLTSVGAQSVVLNSSGVYRLRVSDLVTSVSDNCTVDTFFTVDNSARLKEYVFDCENTGTYSITVIARDTYGNETTDQFNFVVTDDTNPALSCIGNQSVSLDASGSYRLRVSDLVTSVTDNCVVDTFFTVDGGGELKEFTFSCDDIGTYAIEVIARASSGNETTCTLNFTVADDADPSLFCIGNQSVSLDALGSYRLRISDLVTLVSDNCAVDTFFTVDGGAELKEFIFSCDDVGTYTIEVIARDASGNETTCTLDFTVADDTDPSLSCIGNQSVSLDASGSYRLRISDLVTMVSDNCAVDTFFTIDGGAELKEFIFSCDDVGTYTIEVIARDASNNQTTCILDFTVADDTDPSLSCIGDQSVSLDASGSYRLRVSDLVTSVSDNCAVDTFFTIDGGAELKEFTFSCADTGTHSVRVIARDASDNETICTLALTVADNISPTLSCVGNQSVSLDTSGDYLMRVSDLVTSVWDNCAVDTFFTVKGGAERKSIIFNCLDVGDHLIQVIARDASGNETTCSLTITITVVDDIDPQLTCVSDQSVSLDASGAYRLRIQDLVTSVWDNCAVDTFFTVDGGAELKEIAFACADTGTYVIQVIARDASGNATTCTLDFTLSDTTAPTLNCVGDQSVSLNASGIYHLRIQDLVTLVSDNCAADTFFIVDGGAKLKDIIFTCADTGKHVIEIIARDVSGNKTTCTIDFIVVDNTAPTLTCVGNQSVSLNASGTYRLRIQDLVTLVSDNCAVDTFFTVNGGAERKEILFDCNTTGTYAIEVIARDASGNETTCTFNFTVVDTTAPTLNCVGNQSVSLDASGTYRLRIQDLVTSVSDNCAVDTFFTVDGGAELKEIVFNCEDTGTHAIRVIALDASGNEAACTFNFIVSDTISPVIACVGDQSIFLDSSGDVLLKISDLVTSVWDNCAVDTFFTVDGGAERKSIVFNCLDVGDHFIQVIARDASGNETTCGLTITITVVDDIDPQLTCVGDQSVSLDASGTYRLRIQDLVTFVWDNCAVDTFFTVNGGAELKEIVFDCGDTGVHVIQVIARDASGNETTCSLEFVVSDTTAPTLTCVGDQSIYLSTVGDYRLRIQDLVTLVWDNCAVDTFFTVDGGAELKDILFDCRDVGTHTIVVIARDASDNETTCTFTITLGYQGGKIPNPVITPTPDNNELCNGGETLLRLTNLDFDDVTAWQWIVVSPVGTGALAGNSGPEGIYEIKQTLSNLTDSYQTVTYKISPVLYGLCVLDTLYSDVFVNPSPQILVSVPDTSICNDTRVVILASLQSTITPHASVYYDWVVDVNDVSGDQSSSVSVPLNQVIDQELHNPTMSSKDVLYTLTPSLFLNGAYCVSNHTVSHSVTVQPDPVIGVVMNQDTICNEETININIVTANSVSAAQWGVTTTQMAPGDVSVVGSTITNVGSYPYQFTNTSYESRSVSYRFQPEITITRSGYVCSGNDTVPVIAINPTPVMAVAFSVNDSICFDEGTQLDLSTLNRNIIGDLKYELVSVTYGPEVENVGLTPGIYNWTNQISQSALINKSDQVQTVTYAFEPLIQYRGKICNAATAVTQIAYIAPEVKFDLNLKVVPGDWNISCYGNQDGKIDVIDQKGGWSGRGYAYAWNTGATGAIVDGLPAGSYRVVMTDKTLGCHASKDTILTQPDKLIIKLSGTAPDCHGPTGNLTISPQGGTPIPDYTYKWDGPPGYSGSTSFADGLISGKYFIAVSDTNGCVALKDTFYNVVAYGTSTTSFFAKSYGSVPYGSGPRDYYNISCYGKDDGLIEIDSKDITVGSYTWINQNGDTIKSGVGVDIPRAALAIDNLPGGTYSLYLADDKGCEYYPLVQNIVSPPLLTYQSVINQYGNGFEVQCYGDQNGIVTISNVQGGNSPQGQYTYQWVTISGNAVANPTQATQNALSAGEYEFTVSSHNGTIVCNAVDTFVINQPAALNVTATIPQKNGYEIACFGDATGKIMLDVSGGYGSYTYSWTTNDGFGLIPTAEDQDNLTTGTYNVDIAYGGVCHVTRAYVIKSPTQIVDQAVIVGISCHNDSDGSITITPSGGYGTLSYLWQSPTMPIPPHQTTQTGLKAGTYWLTLSDQNNCYVNKQYVLENPTEVVPNISAEDMSCDPGNDGSITLNPTGGTAPYTYTWTTLDGSGLFPNAQNQYSLTAGTYQVVVADSKNCTATATAEIHVPQALVLQAVISNYNGYGIDCFGANTGSINLIIQNGRGPYTYAWSSGQNTPSLEGVKAGTYSVRVVDNFNCSATTQAILTQPDRMWMQPQSQNVTCFDGSNGSISVFSGGGVMPYLYQWSNGATSPIIDHLPAGSYVLTMIDNNACTKDTNIIIQQPSAIKVQFDVTNSFCVAINDGAVRTTVSGGVSPYTYLWPGLNSTSPNVAELKSGDYQLIVTDAQGCTVSAVAEVRPNHDECIQIPNAFSPNDDGTNDYWEITVGDPNSMVHYRLIDLYPEAIIEVYSANWGMLLYRSEKGYPNPWNGKYQGKFLPVNSYLYVIKLNDQIKPIIGNVTIIR